jgi:hypothetical protein
MMWKQTFESEVTELVQGALADADGIEFEDTIDFVVVDKSEAARAGYEFLGMFHHWHDEYPEAEEFKTVGAAKRAIRLARPYRHWAVVVKDYGLETEETIA